MDNEFLKANGINTLEVYSDKMLDEGWIRANEAATILKTNGYRMTYLATLHDIPRKKVKLQGTGRMVYSRSAVEAVAAKLGLKPKTPKKDPAVPTAPAPVMPPPPAKDAEKLRTRAGHIIAAYCNDVITEAEFRQKLASL
jgi:hypothetical protein